MAENAYGVIDRISIHDLDDKKQCVSIKEFLYKGTEDDLHRKAVRFRQRLHDIFMLEVQTFYEFVHSGDVDTTVITGDVGMTPDLYDPKKKIFADVTLSSDVPGAVEAKQRKYGSLLIKGYTVEVYAFDIQTNKVWLSRQTSKRNLSGLFPLPFPDEMIKPIKNGLDIFKTARRFVKADPEAPRKLLPNPGRDNELCEEAKLFSENDEGLLIKLLNSSSFDSSVDALESFELEVEKYLNNKAVEIAKEALGAKSDFKPSEEHEIIKAFQDVELRCSEKYEVIHKPKPSCHGLPSDIEKVPEGVDTRDFVIKRFWERLDGCRHPVVEELLSEFEKHEEKGYPKLIESIKKLESELKEGENLSAKDKEERGALLTKLKTRGKWDRNCLKHPKNCRTDVLLGIGRKDEKPVKDEVNKVKTVPFWDKSFSAGLKAEIKMKSANLLDPKGCWTPHKEYKPDTKEKGTLYHDFIRSQLYQEMAMISQLCSNILRLCTKPRGHYSITTCSSLNLMALIGPGDGIMNDSVTAPILWFSISNDDSLLWMPHLVAYNGVKISNGDRLNKSRLEQMIDAPRIAAVSAAIVACEMEGSKINLLYACGLLASVAMSINIRDSELIDHIRYMVPNIFSERSCSVGYIEDKYDTPLKTRLQALLYTETKHTLRQTASLAKSYYEVEIVNDVITSGGSKIIIPFFDCHVDSVFQLNGIVYTGFFSCKKGLHDPKQENKKMFTKICEYEEKSLKKDLISASFDPESYHYFDPRYVAFSMYNMLKGILNAEAWRSKMFKMENSKSPYQITTFSSLRSSLKPPAQLKSLRSRGSKAKQQSHKYIGQLKRSSASWKEIRSDERTRVVDQFYKEKVSVFELGQQYLRSDPKLSFNATWDQKRQRTGRDREVFILDPPGKVCMYNVESLFKMVCEGIPMEQITLPGNKKIIAMNMKGAQYFKKLNKLKKENKIYENLRMTQDMTKWAPGDNVCKFIYAIASLTFLTKEEKICYINFLCTSIRKKVIMNSVATEAIGKLVADRVVKSDSLWARMLEVDEDKDGIVDCLKSNTLPVRFNWLMGVLNNASSAVHAASADMLERVLNKSYEVHHYQPDVHSDDAAVDVIVEPKANPEVRVDMDLLDYFSRAVKENLKHACIKLSDKKSYIDKHRKEFVSEVDDNGLMRSYWQKQAIAAISTLSYIDFYRDISEGCSKVSNLIGLGGPPTVVNVTMAAVIDLCRDTYSMQPGMINDPVKILEIPRKDIPVELGGPITMRLSLLPIVGLKYQTFSHMMDNLLRRANVRSISQITDSILTELETTEADIFSSIWHVTAEKAVKENLVLDRLDAGLIRFKQFMAFEKTKGLNIIEELKITSNEDIEKFLEADPTLSVRKPDTFEEHKMKMTMLVKNPRWYSSATLQSQGALKLDRMVNVRNACCSPVTNPNQDEPMEKGLLTIPEAIKQAYSYLKSSPVMLNQTYAMLKSMPLMCHVYDVENNVTFKKAHKRQLHPVQKQPFIKEGMISSSVVGLLQYSYTGKTKYTLDYNNLDKELELIDMYKKVLDDMKAPEQAVTIYRIFQHSQGFSSVYYVPNATYRGHDAILGIMATQESDVYNAYPNQRFQPPSNLVYEQLRHSRTLNASQKCSQLACFFMRLCSNQKEAKRLFASSRIDGVPVVDIIKNSRKRRDILYAKTLMDMQPEFVEPELYEITYLVAQQRVFRGWEGEFMAYMNVGNFQGRRGIIFTGKDQSLESLYLIGEISDFPDLKGILTKFGDKMNWKGSMTNHYVETIGELEEGSVYLSMKNYGDHFQTKFHKKGRGLKVSIMDHSATVPVFKYSGITRFGVNSTAHYGQVVVDSRILNQRMTKQFDMENDEFISIFPVQVLWRDYWEHFAAMQKLNIDHMMGTSDEVLLSLPPSIINEINYKGYNAEIAIEMDEYGQQIESKYFAQIGFERFAVGHVWSQHEFNFYLSLAIQRRSQLTNWVSFKGAVMGLAGDFIFLEERIIDRRALSLKSSLSKHKNIITQMILTNGLGYPSTDEDEEEDFSELLRPNDLIDKRIPIKEWGLDEE